MSQKQLQIMKTLILLIMLKKQLLLIILNKQLLLLRTRKVLMYQKQLQVQTLAEQKMLEKHLVQLKQIIMLVSISAE